MASSLIPPHFYRAFEDRHRGSRELIKQRLQVYLPFLLPLAALHPDVPVLDIGCGRGEWLELLDDHAICASGVDTDDGMLAACIERGLDVLPVDALAHLGSLDSASVLAVTGFHIAEHLPFDLLQSLLAQAFRVLMPGGLLILETPNPENLLVGAASFYIDPSHHRPLPSQLLAFLAEHQGFDPVKVLRLQEEDRLAKDGPASLYDVLANVSPDYAVVAQVPLASDQCAEDGQHLKRQLQQAFDMECGISLPALANRYDRQGQVQANSQLQAIKTVEHNAGQALEQLRQLNGDVQRLSNDVSRLTEAIQQTKLQAQHTHAELAAVHGSYSWRVTRPLRWLARFFSR